VHTRSVAYGHPQLTLPSCSLRSQVLSRAGGTSTGKWLVGELVVGSAEAVVDASLERCAGWAFAEASRLRTKDGDGSGRVRCEIRDEGEQCQIVDAAFKLPGGKELTFSTKVMWSVVSKDKVVVAFKHTASSDCSARRTALLTCTRHGAVGDVQLTSVALQLAVRASWSAKTGGGALGKFLEMQLARVSAMRTQYDRSLEADGFRRGEIEEIIVRHAGAYTKEEDEIVALGKSMFKAFDALKSKDVDMRSPQVKGKVAFKKGNRAPWGWAAASVRAT
jgi:hypothetical protein